MITVRGLEPSDKAWLQAEARRTGLSMEAYVRRLIHERRTASEDAERPSEIARRLFGPEHGVDLPPRERFGFRSIEFGAEELDSMSDPS